MFHGICVPHLVFSYLTEEREAKTIASSDKTFPSAESSAQAKSDNIDTNGIKHMKLAAANNRLGVV